MIDIRIRVIFFFPRILWLFIEQKINKMLTSRVQNPSLSTDQCVTSDEFIIILCRTVVLRIQIVCTCTAVEFNNKPNSFIYIIDTTNVKDRVERKNTFSEESSDLKFDPRRKRRFSRRRRRRRVGRVYARFPSHNYTRSTQ